MSTAALLDRRSLLAPLTGTVLEIGPGRGVNLPHYRSDVTWIGLEPSGRKHGSIRAAARRTQRDITLHDGVAEAIPLPEASVDAVVSTFVLCSVADPERALTEIRRVLRPGGSFVFLEHVGPPRGTASRRVMDAWARLQIGYCRPNRDTVATLERAGFADLRHTESIARPLGFTVADHPRNGDTVRSGTAEEMTLRRQMSFSRTTPLSRVSLLSLTSLLSRVTPLSRVSLLSRVCLLSRVSLLSRVGCATPCGAG